MDRSAEATGSPRTGKAAAARTLAASDGAATPHETPEAGRAGESPPETGRAGESPPETGRAGESPPETGRAGESPPETGRAGESPPETGRAGESPPETGRAGESPPETGRAGESPPETGRAGESPPETGRAGNETLAAGVAAGIERLIGLLRWLSPPSGLSLTSTATLATLERSGPARLTALAASEGVTQPAMTQLIARLEEAALVTRATDPADGRAVAVRITAEGQALLARRRFYRAERLTGMLAELSPEQQLALAAALPAMDALTSAHRGVPLTAAQPS